MAAPVMAQSPKLKTIDSVYDFLDRSRAVNVFVNSIPMLSMHTQFSLPFRHSFWKHDEAQGPLDVNLLRDGTPQAAESNERE